MSCGLRTTSGSRRPVICYAVYTSPAAVANERTLRVTSHFPSAIPPCSHPRFSRQTRFTLSISQIRLQSVRVRSLSTTLPSPHIEESPWCWNNSLRWKSCLAEPGSESITIEVLSSAEYSDWLAQQPAQLQQCLSLGGFKGRHREVIVMPTAEGFIDQVLMLQDKPRDMWSYAALVNKLPAGTFRLPEDMPQEDADRAALGWILGHYKFRRYKTSEPAGADNDKPQLEWPSKCNRKMVEAFARAYYFARDLINTPADDLGPQHLAAEAAALAAFHCAPVQITQGEELLKQGYPAVHTVGRASHRPPVVVDIQWKPALGESVSDLPLVALIGKGVCFDTGGLNIKSGAGMKFMKKDMGGAAFVLALAHVIMSAGLPVSLRVMVPAVENAISGNSFRPLDVLQTRSGRTVENGNTDAEGRLILSDCIYEAAGQQPDLLVDVATLTGAARAALGPEMPAVFCNDDEVAGQLLNAAAEQGESLWRLPLHAGYRKLLDSKVADLGSTGGEGTPGAVVAALFLQEFIQKSPRWIHMDTGAWTTAAFSGPGRPEGGEALGLLSFWYLLKQRYTQSREGL